MNSDKRGYMIPKTIHYIWIGNEMPSLNKECISTWEQNAPGFDIQFWDLNKIQRELMPAPFFYEMLKKKNMPLPLITSAARFYMSTEGFILIAILN